MSDEAEALAGTSPLDGGDILEITGIRGLSASEETILRRGEATDGVELRWRTKEGKRYRVMTGDDVLGPFSAVATNIPGTGGTAVYVDRKAAGRSRGFYRVELDGE
jgi:hypothetical protein